MAKQRLVVCTVCENEAARLPEFLAYHRVVGVDHFVLYDTGSTDDPARAVRVSGLTEHVTLVAWPQSLGRAAAYRHFTDSFSPGYEWAAFIDLDEFLLPLNGRSVTDTLDRLGGAAVLVHRRVFGPEAWRETPWGLVIERHDRRAADDFPGNSQAKPVVRCGALLDVGQHGHEFRINGPVLNTAGDLATRGSVQAQPCFQNLVINHYASRSRGDWLAKSRRRTAAGEAAVVRDDPGFDRLAEICRTHDATIQSFAGAVRDLLGLGAASTQGASMGGAGAEAARSGPIAEAVAAPSLDMQPTGPGTVVAVPLEATPSWVGRGPDALERADGAGFVFRDRSRRGDHWHAAIRGTARAMIDPSFLFDEFDRIRDFPSDAAARIACDQALGRGVG